MSVLRALLDVCNPPLLLRRSSMACSHGHRHLATAYGTLLEVRKLSVVYEGFFPHLEGTRTASSVGGSYDHQWGPQLDRVALLDLQRLHLAVPVGHDHVLHLHRLQH